MGHGIRCSFAQCKCLLDLVQGGGEIAFAVGEHGEVMTRARAERASRIRDAPKVLARARNAARRDVPLRFEDRRLPAIPEGTPTSLTRRAPA